MRDPPRCAVGPLRAIAGSANAGRAVAGPITAHRRRPQLPPGAGGPSSVKPQRRPPGPTPSSANATGVSSRRRGKLKALVARSILVIIWNLLADPAARYQDLGAGYHTSRIRQG